MTIDLKLEMLWNRCTLADHAFLVGKGFQLEKKKHGRQAYSDSTSSPTSFKSTHGPHVGLDPRATTVRRRKDDSGKLEEHTIHCLLSMID